MLIVQHLGPKFRSSVTEVKDIRMSDNIIWVGIRGIVVRSYRCPSLKVPSDVLGNVDIEIQD